MNKIINGRKVAIYYKHGVLEDMPCNGSCTMSFDNNVPAKSIYITENDNNDSEYSHSCCECAMRHLWSFPDDWSVYKMYVDTNSGNEPSKKRKAFSEMMQDAENGNFDLIVVNSMSRFVRNPLELLQTVQKLSDINVEVYFSEEHIWTMQEESRLAWDMLRAILVRKQKK